ncbi:unnamed protein product [Rotaria sp. Silwood2]|nr:unnamed protein product [Rotaria sp. Silwood2]CAF2979864.1 unnamed protein product [Rotaria sp. Silwood2]CAF3101181.1 unnamed protein product [Rotaria sp. Silwood2]CAF3312429.1 unnamed protein product [Rotaria sp. Silwood2]
MAGLMGVTAFLSMWINNSASTSIMMPVALAIINELERHGKNFITKRQHNTTAIAVQNDAFDSTDVEVPIENTSNEIHLDTQSNKASKHEVPVEVKTHFRFVCCKQQKMSLIDPVKQKYDQLRKGFLLSVAYSSSIGGLSSLVGTGPNVYLKGFTDE